MSNTPPDPRLARRRASAEELDKQSEITEADVDAAVDAFARYAPTEARKILDAKPVE